MKTQAKQVDTFGQLVGFCKSQGSMFNPSQDSMKIEALESLLQTAREKTEIMYNDHKAVTWAINQRRDALKHMQKIVTRAYNAAIATKMSPSLLEDLRNVKVKLTGNIRGKTSSPQADDPSQVKTGRGPIPQADVVSKMRNFTLFIKLLELHDGYTPNESEISIEGLKSLLEMIETSQVQLVTSQIKLNRSKEACRLVIQKEEGIYGLSKLIKVYVKSAFGVESDAFTSISKLKFVSR
ncbi:MAG TPA: hypothetical protein VD927_02075 [Chryseosolibacter sp.]|nr:hypothetical protein [Chryseosolibacter sp.]